MDEKRFRFDLLIAISALLISTIAALASVYQTHVVAQQLGAAVWPYLGLDHDYDAGTVKIVLTNYGLGPALVRAAWLVDDTGKLIPSYEPIIKSFNADLKRRHAHGAREGYSAGSIDSSTVLAPGAVKTLLAVTATGAATGVIQKVSDLTIHVCYCSLLGTCWELDSSPNSRTIERPDCPLDRAITVSTPSPTSSTTLKPNPAAR